MLHKGLGQGLRGGGQGEKTLRHGCLGWLPPGLQSSSICLAVLTLADSRSLPSQEGTQKPTWRC